MQTNQADTGDDWLERALRAEGGDHRASYIADDGFTARVLARLPQAATAPAWRRPAVVLLWLCAGAGAALAVPGLFDEAFRNGVALLVGHRMGLADIVALVAVLGAATWGTLVYAARAD